MAELYNVVRVKKPKGGQQPFVSSHNNLPLKISQEVSLCFTFVQEKSLDDLKVYRVETTFVAVLNSSCYDFIRVPKQDELEDVRHVVKVLYKVVLYFLLVHASTSYTELVMLLFKVVFKVEKF